jgi:predicted metalloprotease with PDZ domain
MKYQLNRSQSHQHYLLIQLAAITPENETILQLPAWRPGRYEIGNFAKNIKEFYVTNKDGKKLEVHKTTKDQWLVNTSEVNEIIVSYSYYSIDFNAGSTYLGDEVLYVNPVNCFVYIPNQINQTCELEIPLESNEKIACGVSFLEGKIRTQDFHELADTPFLVSKFLQEKSFEVNDVKFYVWFYGECKPQWEKVIIDFKRFTEYQVQKFGDFPVKEYHFINIIHPHKAYHGVEHTTSTIIVLGPSYEVMNERYVDLLGVSSHELYHAWNIKTIRPAEMNPYDYTQENYSKLGYVAEGVTTYMGDLMLHESGVFDKKAYANELNQYLRRHYSNGGRLNKSVADSSYDTWLDGYSVGAPDRKSSIYIEGALVSFMIDTKIREGSNHIRSMHDVMKDLYEDFGKKAIGYTELDYKKSIETHSKQSFDEFFDHYIWGCEDFTNELKICLKQRGFELVKNSSANAMERFGIITKPEELKEAVILHVAENSSAWNSGLAREDKIISVNGYVIDNNLNQWLNYFEGDSISMQVEKGGKLEVVSLGSPNEFQFWDYKVTG